MEKAPRIPQPKIDISKKITTIKQKVETDGSGPMDAKKKEQAEKLVKGYSIRLLENQLKNAEAGSDWALILDAELKTRSLQKG